LFVGCCVDLNGFQRKKYENKMEQILNINKTFILVLLMILGCSLLAQTAEQPSGAGTENDP